MITLDGSLGEGGGQILRTALSLSMVTGKPFRMENIRAKRPKPGLLRQHLTAVQAAQTICQATVEGANLGSRLLTFVPQTVVPADYHFDIGTAGSTTLVLQTVLPALMTASTCSRLVLEGGTHNPHAPPYDFLAATFVPLLHRMGAKVNLHLQRYGFYPAGGGRIEAIIEPAAQLQPLELRERGPMIRQTARALLSKLPQTIGDRELRVVRERLGWNEAECQVESISALSPGNVLLLEIMAENVTEVLVGFGERGVPAETVAARVVAEAQHYLTATVPVGEHLADQLLIPLALAGRGSFRTLPLTSHTTTNIQTIQQFLPVRIEVQTEPDQPCLIQMQPA